MKEIATCTEDYNDLFENDVVYSRNFDEQPAGIYDKDHVFLFQYITLNSGRQGKDMHFIERQLQIAINRIIS